MAKTSEMSVIDAKRTMRALTESVIKKKEVNQYTLDIYSNIITQSLLSSWADGYNKVTIKRNDKPKSKTFEFIPPKIGQDFISRYINGGETLNAHLHKSPEIRIVMPLSMFDGLTDPDAPFKFFKMAITYYNSTIEKAANKLLQEVFKLGHNMKHLISTTKLSGIVSYPIMLLFTADDIKMGPTNPFTITKGDMETLNNFIKNISSRYASPEKEKREIIDDVKSMIEVMREACELSDTLREITYLPECLELLYNGDYDDIILESSRKFIDQQVNMNMNGREIDNLMFERAGPKRLKKIPADLIPYIRVETEAIQSSNDKMLIASYCSSKLEIVEWYIELLVTRHQGYVVPHTKQQLEGIRTQLLACLKSILDKKVYNPGQRPLIDIQYPRGYEG